MVAALAVAALALFVAVLAGIAIAPPSVRPETSTGTAGRIDGRAIPGGSPRG